MLGVIKVLTQGAYNSWLITLFHAYEGKIEFLHRAVGDGNIENVEILLNEGADVIARNSHGLLPIYIATTSGDLDVVNCLINEGAEGNKGNR